jgi:hypothetical protein
MMKGSAENTIESKKIKIVEDLAEKRMKIL